MIFEKQSALLNENKW